MREFPAPELEKVLRAVCENPHSSFYRGQLGNIESSFPLTVHHWQRIPAMPRTDAINTPLWERMFVAREDVHYIRNSYGTSGKGILITPRVSYGEYTDPYARLGVTRILNFFASAHFDFPQAHNGVVSLFGDVADLKFAAHIAKRMGIDGIYLAPFSALVFGDLLKEQGIAHTIKMVQLCGERCSPLQFDILKKQYPNAAIISNYSSSETREAVAFPCIHSLTAPGSLAIEPVSHFYCEILDPETGKPIEKDGVYGELALTTLSPTIPFPLVRYLTGDVAAYVKRDCGCDRHSRAFEIIGRMTVFPVRLVKGELKIAAVEEALNSLGVVSQYFEVHYTDEAVETKALPRVSISLVRAGNTPDAAVLARAIEKKLRVFPTYTYAQGVEAGLYLPLTISFIEQPQGSPSGKGLTPIVVRHIAGDEASTRSGSGLGARV